MMELMFGKRMRYDVKSKHIILKWNEMPFFHEKAPDTIFCNANVLDKFSKSTNPEERYVWWGKISVSNHLGDLEKYINEINNQAKKQETYLFLYCPDSPHPTMHVARVLEISREDQSASQHTPSYYGDLLKKYKVPYWFKISDITRASLFTVIQQLLTTDNLHYDPVQANSYPMVVYLNRENVFFPAEKMYESLLGGYQMRCFKTGNNCSFEILYNPKQVFIGCPFNKAFLTRMKFAVRPILENLGCSVWIASDVFSNFDVMCKVCKAIQSSGKAIIDITGWNPNVLLELGLLYGNNKDVLLLKQKDEKIPVDLSGMEYLEYDPDDFEALGNNLIKYFKGEGV